MSFGQPPQHAAAPQVAPGPTEVPGGILALGISFIVYGVLVIFGTLASTASNLATGPSGMFATGTPGGSGEQAGYVVGTIIAGLLGFVIAGMSIAGGLKIRSARSHSLAVATAVVAMLPCTGCCLLGFPLGVWGLVVLLRPETKQLFAR